MMSKLQSALQETRAQKLDQQQVAKRCSSLLSSLSNGPPTGPVSSCLQALRTWLWLPVKRSLWAGLKPGWLRSQV